ncbi:MAG: YraN family protein [Bacteroidota bacterium]|nr:YraN family protein [Bacteroidota bacterium]
MSDNKSVGAKGEQFAAEYLKDKGYEILEMNWVAERCEVDIIAKYNSVIIFVEVKTRTNDFYGNPEEAVNEAKQENLMKVADAYLIENDLDNEIRFDIISIIWNKNRKDIYHIEDAIVP